MELTVQQAEAVLRTVSKVICWTGLYGQPRRVYVSDIVWGDEHPLGAHTLVSGMRSEGQDRAFISERSVDINRRQARRSEQPCSTSLPQHSGASPTRQPWRLNKDRAMASCQCLQWPCLTCQSCTQPRTISAIVQMIHYRDPEELTHRIATAMAYCQYLQCPSVGAGTHQLDQEGPQTACAELQLRVAATLMAC